MVGVSTIWPRMAQSVNMNPKIVYTQFMKYFHLRQYLGIAGVAQSQGSQAQYLSCKSCDCAIPATPKILIENKIFHFYILRSLRLCDSCDSKNSYRKKNISFLYQKKNISFLYLCDSCDSKNSWTKKFLSILSLRSLRLCDSCDSKNMVDKKIFHSTLIIEPAIFATV